MAEPANKSRRRKKRGHIKMAAAAAAALLVLVLLSISACETKQQPTDYEPDSNAAPMTENKSRSAGELREELQSQADESSFRMQFNAKPVVRGNQAELLLGNPAENKMYLSVSISLDEDGEILYESDPLVPGAQVLTAELKRTLPAGEYRATAVCTVIDPETGEAVGPPIQAELLLNAVEPEETGETPGQSPG